MPSRSSSSATSRAITRAGVVEALDADYTRTAYLKGLPRNTVIRRMFCETLSCRRSPSSPPGRVPRRRPRRHRIPVQLPGNRADGVQAREQKDFTLLTAGVLVVGVVYLVVTLMADILFAAAQPADPTRRRRVTESTPLHRGRRRSARHAPRARERLDGSLLRSARASHRHAGASSSGSSARILGDRDHAVRPDLRPDPFPTCRRSTELPVRNRQPRPRRLLARARGLAGHPAGRPCCDPHRDRARHGARPHHRLLPRLRRRQGEPAHRRRPGDAADRARGHRRASARELGQCGR